MERESWHWERGDGGSLAPDLPEGTRLPGAEGPRARRLRSLAVQLARCWGRLDGGGPRRTQERVSLPNPTPMESELELGLGETEFKANCPRWAEGAAGWQGPESAGPTLCCARQDCTALCCDRRFGGGRLNPFPQRGR